jgi:hypothetical protein
MVLIITNDDIQTGLEAAQTFARRQLWHQRNQAMAEAADKAAAKVLIITNFNGTNDGTNDGTNNN